MFVTFYSYKGGVGRTLALANVAYLLATHSEEPCRVLVWDFDLEAPGLDRVFNCRWDDNERGFVDLVHEYLTQTRIPDVNDFIHETDVDGVDVLPAGRVGPDYSAMLEEIEWREVYDKRRGQDLMDRIRSDLARSPGERGRPKYDYVLIDSRTGYSDVGGICVQQLPDVVVLMFRPNDQNIDGISEVRNAIKQHSDAHESRDTSIIPVIGPVWPFGSTDAAEYMGRAQAEFDGDGLLSITFEAALTYGERIISRDKERYATPLRILDDYEQLTAAIRAYNPRDPLTIGQEAARLSRTGNVDRLAELYVQLIEANPQREEHWGDLIRGFDLARIRGMQLTKDTRERIQKLIDDTLRENPEDTNAMLTQAWLHMRSDRRDEAITWFAKATEIAPENVNVHIARARGLLSLGETDQALDATNAALEHLPDNEELLILRADCHRAMGSADDALEDYVLAFEKGVDDPFAVRGAAELAFQTGAYGICLELLHRLPAHVRRDQYIILRQIHALGAVGRAEEARSILREAATEGRIPLDLNYVEALVAVGEPTDAMIALGQLPHAHDTGTDILRAVILACQEEVGDGQKIVDDLVTQVPSWDFTELRVWAETAPLHGNMTEKTSNRLLHWFRQLAPGDGRSDPKELMGF